LSVRKISFRCDGIGGRHLKAANKNQAGREQTQKRQLLSNATNGNVSK